MSKPQLEGHMPPQAYRRISNGKNCSPSWLPPHVSIQWQELFAILAAALAWGHHWKGRRIRFHCDNLSIVQAWNHKSCRNPAISKLFRHLFLTAAKGNFTIALKHLPGKINSLADALSRNLMTRSFSLAPQAHPQPTLLPAELTRI